MRNRLESSSRRQRVAQIAALALVWAIAVAALVSERVGNKGAGPVPVKTARAAGAGPSGSTR